MLLRACLRAGCESLDGRVYITVFIENTLHALSELGGRHNIIFRVLAFVFGRGTRAGGVEKAYRNGDPASTSLTNSSTAKGWSRTNVSTFFAICVDMRG